MSPFNNVEVVFNDVMKTDLEEIEKKLGEKYVLVANLPYYITTPIILGLLSKETRISRYVMMMQLEMADRICGKPKTKDYNALSVFIQYYSNAKIAIKIILLINVKYRGSFNLYLFNCSIFIRLLQ